MANARRFLREHGWSYAFIAPSIITFACFTFAPVVWSAVISVQKYNLRTGGTFVDPIWMNYQKAFTGLGGIFVTSIGNTLTYTVFTVTTNIVVGLALASLIQPLHRHVRTFFRAAFYLPAVTSSLIVGMTWAYIYNAQWGFANYLLRLIGVEPVRWLSNPDIVLGSITASAMLTIPATAVVLFSAAMGGIPTEFYEAADLDGASPVQKWWWITLPLIRPTTLYLTVIYTIASFEVFERIYVMVPSGVGRSTQTIVTQIYYSWFKDFDLGVSAAQAMMLFVMIGAVALVQFRVLRSNVEY